MTVSSTTNSVSYTGDGAVTEFSVTFKFYEITVYENNNGVVTAKTEGTHYTVAGGEGATGTVTMLTAPASGVILHIRRTTAKTQEVDYAENDAFPAETQEQALDRQMMALHEIGQRVDYNPTAAAETGTLTTVTTQGRYSQIGDTVFFRARLTCTDIGTGAGYLSCTLPVTAVGAAGTFVGVGRNDTDDVLLQFETVSSTVIAIKTLAGAFPASNSDVIHVSGIYHAG